MANFSRAKVLKLAKGFRGRSKNCFGLALRRVHKALQYKYISRRLKKRNIRREWIVQISAAAREHGFNYSQFVMCLNRSNVNIDRKILADLAINEPYSFKTVVDEVKRQNKFVDQERVKPKLAKQTGLLYNEALDNGILRPDKPTPEEIEEIRKMILPKSPVIIKLRNKEDEKDPKKDYARLSFVEEDEEFLKDQARITISEKEQKKLPREVLTDNWEEDFSLYKHKRKP